MRRLKFTRRFIGTFLALLGFMSLNAKVLYVDADAAGADDGSSWQDAYLNLSVAIEAAQSGDQVWVAAGIYYPTSQPNYPVGSADPRFNHFTLKNGVSLYGGFAGDETRVDQRDLVAYKTVISGDIDQNDNVGENGYVTSYTGVVGENSYKLFYFPEGSTIDTTAVLDGFVLAGAVANSDVFPYMGGAAMLCQGASPKVVNCEFYGNYAQSSGGAIWVKESQIIISKCSFSGNHADWDAGAVCFNTTDANLIGCTFINNTAKYGGAVNIALGADVSLIEDCYFSGNYSSQQGGAIASYNARSLIKNSVLVNNEAEIWGGGIAAQAKGHNNSFGVDIINCTINSNVANTWGGGIGVQAIDTASLSSIEIINSKIQGNTSIKYGGAIGAEENCEVAVYNSMLSGNKADNGSGDSFTGAAIALVYGATGKVCNTTITGNKNDNTSTPCAVVSHGSGSKLEFYNSIVNWNNADDKHDEWLESAGGLIVFYNSCSYGISGNGNYNQNPYFLSDPNLVTAPSTEGDYRLWGNSPVNNKGAITYLPKDKWDLDNDGDLNENLPIDLNGNPRVFAGVVDMGCYEQQLLQVSGNAIGMLDNSHLQLGRGVALDGTDFTIECWYYMQEGMDGSWHNIFGPDPLAVAGDLKKRSPIMYVFQNDRIHYGYGDNVAFRSGDTEKALKLNQWNHIALTFNDASNTMNVYANGKLLETIRGGEVCSTPVFFINNDEELHGLIDEFRIWKEERSLQDLLDNMNASLTGNEQNLELYYNFNQVTYGEIEDIAGGNNGIISELNGNLECGLYNSEAIGTPVLKGLTDVGIDGFTFSWNPVAGASEYYVDVALDDHFVNKVISGQPTSGETSYTVKGLSKGTVYYYKVTSSFGGNAYQYSHAATKLNPPGNALQFDGHTYVDATDICKYDYANVVTVECWVNKTGDNSSYASEIIWACNAAAGDNNYLLFVDHADGHVFLTSKNTSGNIHEMHFAKSAILGKGWHHVAVTIDNSSGVARLYIDGLPPSYPKEPVSLAPLPYGTVFSIGQEFDGMNPSDLFVGQIDEFRIWNKILDQSAIQKNMNNTLTGNEEDLVAYYNFDQQTGHLVADVVNGFDGEIVGNIQWVKSTLALEDFVVEASSQNTSGFVLSWDAVLGASKYNVDVAIDAAFKNKVVDAASVTGTSYNAKALSQGTKYYFRVISDNDDTSKVNYTSTLMEVPGNALWLDGKDDYVDISKITEMGIHEIVTMECWVYMDPTETVARFLAINPADGSNKFLLSYEGESGYCLFDANSGVNIKSYDTRKGAWVHLAAAMHSGSTTSFYLNGELVGTAPNGQCPVYPGEYISIGQEYDGSRLTDFFKGAIDEVRFWKGTRTQQQILDNMYKKLSGGEAGLLAYYDFDQSEGPFVYDKVNGLDGTIVSQPQWGKSDALITPAWIKVDDVSSDSFDFGWWPVDGATEYKIQLATDANFNTIVEELTQTGTHGHLEALQENTDYYFRISSFTNRWSGWSVVNKISTLLIPPGNALAFDGVDDQVNLGDIMASDWAALTVEAWVKAQPEQSESWPRLVGNYDNTALAGFGLALFDVSYESFFEIRDVSRIQHTVVGKSQINDNVWHHVAAVFTGSKLLLYVDGVLEDENDLGGTYKIKNSDIDCGIGNANDGFSWRILNGLLDEVRIWNVARTQTELKEFAHKPLTGYEDGLVSYYNLDKAEGTSFADMAGNNNGTMLGTVEWAESKALITPFVLPATDVTAAGFTAHWDSVPNATKYILRVATDKLLTQPVEGMESIEVGDVLTYDVAGLLENTNYYYGVMSITDRASAWSVGEPVKTSGSGSGELAAAMIGDANYVRLDDHLSKVVGKNAGAVTGWFKKENSERGNIFQIYGNSSNYMDISVGDVSGYFDDESFVYRLKRGNSYQLYMWVRKGHDYFTDNNWHHFAVITGDGNNRILIDGKEQEVHIVDGDGTLQSQEFSNIDNADKMHLGRNSAMYLDEIAVYKNPLTDQEVLERAHKKLNGNETGLVAYYPFDNSNAADSSGFGRDGIVEGTITYQRANVLITPFLNEVDPGVTLANLSWGAIESATEYIIDVATDKNFQNKIVDNLSLTESSYRVTGLNKNTKYFYRVKAKVADEWSEYSAIGEIFTLPGNALVLDGVDDYLTADDITQNASAEATIECWVKLDENAGDNTKPELDRNVIWAINTSDVRNHYVLLYYPYNGLLKLWSDYEDYIELTDVNLGSSWHHIAVSLSNTDSSYIYIDGKPVISALHDINAIETGCKFSIGQEWDNVNGTDIPSDFYKGEIDEFRVWDIALTQEEVRANMNLSEPEGADEHYIAHYTFDEYHINDSDTVFKDLAKQNDATLVNGPTITKSEGVIIPITLEADNATLGAFDMHINDIASAASFEIEVAYDETFVPPLAIHENIGRNLNYTVDELCPGVKYYYRARAIYNENTISEWSTVDTVWTVDEDAEIQNFEASQGDYSELLKLRWDCINSYLISEFRITRRIEGAHDFDLVAMVPNNTDLYQYTDSAALPGTYYEYAIQGLSYCYGNDTEIDTTNIGYNLPTLELSKEIDNQTQEAYIRLDWAYHPDFCKNVEITRINTETGITQVFQEVADSLHYLDADVQLCVPYSYKLTAKTADYGEVDSRTKVFTLEENLKGVFDTLDATKGYTDSKVTLTWTSHKQNIIDEYQINRRKYDQGFNWQVVDVIDKGTTQVWIDKDANPGEYYEYMIVAVGTCGENTLYSDSVTTVGFRQPEGVIAGQVNYKGGNPVKHVRLTVNYDEADKIYGRCLQFDGNDSMVIKAINSFDVSKGLTFETWIRPTDMSADFTLFENSGLAIKYTAGDLIAGSGSASVAYDIKTDNETWKQSSWNHIAVSANADSLHMLINGQLVSSSVASTSLAFDQFNYVGDAYTGFIDEMRIWNFVKSDSLLARHHDLVLPRDESNLICALRFDEGLGSYAFDHTRTSDVPNKTHATIYGAQWSDAVPSLAKLALAGKTEMNGNYIVKGIWFKGSGETFSITPSFGVHEFDPATRNMLISENSIVYNGQDFTDISAFMVTGDVYYKGTGFPVEGVNVLVDGSYVMNEENMPVATNEIGQFELEVPIGEHYLSLVKNGHVFSEGYFPPKKYGEIQYHNFQDNVSGIQLVDSTTYKLAGRIVGGRREGDKEIGFGKSVNNIGQYTVQLTTTKGYELDEKGHDFVEFTTDAETGEYEIQLLPEVYATLDVSPAAVSSHYNFNDGDIIDMSESHIPTDVNDTLYVADQNGNDSVSGIDTYSYNVRKDWIYRSTPSLDVTNVDGGKVISDLTYTTEDADGNEVVLDLVEETDGVISYPFGKPVFHYGGEYNVLISIFEEYENYQTSAKDRVPVTHGNIEVTNELSTNPSAQNIDLTDSGKVVYTFYGGFPNLTVDNTTPSLSYTKKMEIKAFPENGTPVAWEPVGGDYFAYLMGAKATGNNFVTTGPNEVKFVLRDPPGSNSYAYYEAGFTTSQSSSFNIASSSGTSMNKEVSFSPTINFSVGGFGFEKQTEIASDNAKGVTQSTEITQSSNMEWSTTTTYMSSYQTSDDPAYVGAEGDLFFGNSTNIVYGLSNFLEIMPTEKATEVAGNELDGYSMGTRTGMRLNPEFGTMFIYSQNHIENYLIPNLKMLRDLQLANFPDKYEAVFTDVTDDKYGTDNDDVSVWGDQASANKYNGPSYIFHALAPDDPNWHIDSVRFFNQQIRGWEDLLARNEWEKMQAQSMINNVSFDAGAVYESSITTATESSVTTSFEITVSQTIARSHGVTVDDVGATFSMERTNSRNISFESSTANTSERTVGFVLADGDQGDYYTVDVKKCKYGNGPVFITRGGQSSCPYEGEDLSKYYEPGQHTLNYATMRIEVPEISAVENSAINVPEDQPAMFTLKISNLSEADADVWYMVKVDAASNPYGAKVKLDGGSMNSGVAILVPAGTTLTKTLEIGKGRADVNDYKDINIIMHSLCQFDPTDDVEDIVDTVTLSAYFVPVCTSVDILKPDDNWLVNVNAEDQLKVQLGGYNLQHTAFEKMALQYKPESGSVWFTQAMFFNDTAEYGSYTGDKAKIDGQAIVDYVWNTKPVQDRNYQLRAVSYCTDNSTAESEIYNGIIDGNSPQVFGTPSPADGILDPNDDIVITFNEPIEAGLILPRHITVEGVLNGSEINHGTSVAFDGEGDYAKTPEGLNLDNSSYSIEFWMQKATGASGTVVSQGTAENQQVQLAVTADDILLMVNTSIYKTANPFKDENWHHYAVVYNNSNNLMQLYVDDQIAMEQAVDDPTSTGAFYFGKSGIEGNENYLNAKVHDVRVWKRPLAYNDVIEQMNVNLSGNEIGLAAYWPMDEGDGSVLNEKAHSRNAAMYATWSLYPLSSAYEFDGSSKALAFKMGSIPVTEEMDFTVEFWMKAGAQDAGACIFSNGNASIDAYLPEKTISFELATDGQLEVKTNNKVLASGSPLADDAWHHIAFVVNRRAYASLFVDGEKVESVTATSVGSMQNAYGYIGARGYIDNTQQYQLDNYFSGSVDELRVWKVARKQEQLDLYQKSKLDGTEVGLCAYFPFEDYTEVMGVMLSEETLVDKSINQYSGENNCDTLYVFAEESFTKNSPAMKRSRPKQAVNFDYVIGEDRIVITPKDDLAVIENCVLEISVQGVQDLHGNAMASPATWTAYIDKNQVVWADDRFSFEKELDGALRFSATVVNEGGTPQDFAISNLPSWLSVSPEMGVLDPDSDIELEFTVREGINIGNYSEDLYLESNTGYNERLTLDLRVFKQAPDWTVDEDAYQYSMNLISQLKIKEIISNDKYDMIGVFVGDECRGVCNLEYQSNYDSYFAFLVVYGNLAEEELEFRVWDASEGKIYTDVSPLYVFEPNQFYGTMAEPELLDVGGRINNELALNSGWNWISFNLEMEDASIQQLFSGFDLSNGDVVKHAETFATYDDAIDMWFGTVYEAELGKLYRLKISNTDTLEYVGTEVKSADFPIELVLGWNRIGYIPTKRFTVNEALAGFEPQVNDVVKSRHRFAMYDGDKWIGSLSYMEPGQGYMYNSSNTDIVSFAYPESSLKSGVEFSDEEGFELNNYEYAMSIVAEVVGIGLPAGAKLNAYVDGELRGFSEFSNLKSYAGYSFITVYGASEDLNKTVTFSLIDGDTETLLKGSGIFKGNASEGDLTKPVVLGADGVTAVSVNNHAEVSVSPNPFAESFAVGLSLAHASNVQIALYNSIGGEVAVLLDKAMNAGRYTVECDGEQTGSLAAGVYFIKVVTSNAVQELQIIKK